MEYLRQIFTAHGGTLLLLMVISISSMARIFMQLSNLRFQAMTIDELVPRLRAALSSGNVAKAAVAAESDDSCIGRLMAAILREPTRDAKRMRLIYKLNIDEELRVRLGRLVPLKGWSIVALILGLLGAFATWYTGMPETIALKRAIVLGSAGSVVFLYAIIFYVMLKRREIELNDILAAEAISLIDTTTRRDVEEYVG
jgi:hypothetical protein